MSRISSTSATGINPTIGITGTTAPTSAVEIGAISPLGNIEGLLIDSNGALVVNASGSFEIQNLNISYNEVNAVPVGVETAINTYTAPLGKISYLLSILCSGQNIGQFNIYKGVSLFDKQYITYTLFNATFDYKTGASSVPGFIIGAGNTITVKTVNNGTSSALYSARMMILEVG